MSSRTRTLLLLIAILLVIVAAMWGYVLNNNSTLGRLTILLEGYGYVLTEDSLYLAGSAKDSSINELIPSIPLAEAEAASKAAGFPSDFQKKGNLELVLSALPNGDVITVFLIDEEVEAAFVQVPSSEQVYPLGETPDATNSPDH